jgi:hypothetical protein
VSSDVVIAMRSGVNTLRFPVFRGRGFALGVHFFTEFKPLQIESIRSFETRTFTYIQTHRHFAVELNPLLLTYSMEQSPY